MRESYVEGITTHDGPRSCADARKGGGEASDRGTHGPGIEPRNAQIQDADAVIRCGRQHVRHRHREMTYGPARSETPCTCGTSLRENREICELLGAMVRRAALERP
jgi:hypothetical protein